PLCQFFLGDSLAQSSANFFKSMVIRGFLSGRRNYETWLPSQDETSLLLRPLRHLLKQKGVALYPRKEVTHFQCNAHCITGVTLQDGTRMTADGYVAAMPPHSLMPCLPERLLAKYSYFCGLSNLRDNPALIVHIEVPAISSRPRLFLSHHPFHWISNRTERRHNGTTTVFSCVVTGNHYLLNESDHRILDQALADIQASFYPRVPQELQRPFGTQILRVPHCFLSPHPSQSAQRPLQQSPFSNFFLAGPWTDTGLPASRESSILSAQMCAQSIVSSTISPNIDNLILQS
ncbi:MAG: FAD-dependent oxidoreductase, partial [Nitrospirota bacterium]